MKLENWSVVCKNYDPYLAPELYQSALYGNVFGHPRFDDGDGVTTSSLVGKQGEIIITKSGSEYELGIVDPDYEKKYPDAKNRLLNSLKEMAL
jgi:hypothetical protein